LTPTPSLWNIIVVFGRVSATSFGGGTMSAIRRETVRAKRWISEDEYLELVALGNLLPGSNPINVAVLIGSHLRGWIGALAAFLASVIPGFAILMVLGAIALDSHLPWMAGALGGCAAVAVGLTLANAIEMTRKRLNVVDLALMAAVAAAVLVVHLSLGLTLLIFLPIALLATHRPAKRAAS
jgi:chromate transporter